MLLMNSLNKEISLENITHISRFLHSLKFNGIHLLIISFTVAIIEFGFSLSFSYLQQLFGNVVNSMYLHLDFSNSYCTYKSLNKEKTSKIIKSPIKE